MLRAIVYTSNTGNTAAYAKLLGERLSLPVVSLAQAGQCIPAGSKVIYLGWLMAGNIKGYRAAAKRYSIQAVCGVGMGGTGGQTDEVRKNNNIPDTTPLFTLQGGFDRSKLRGIYRLMMNIMVKTAGKALCEKQNRTAEEDDMLELMLQGGSRVSMENLGGILHWYHSATTAQ